MRIDKQGPIGFGSHLERRNGLLVAVAQLVGIFALIYHGSGSAPRCAIDGELHGACRSLAGGRLFYLGVMARGHRSGQAHSGGIAHTLYLEVCLGVGGSDLCIVVVAAMAVEALGKAGFLGVLVGTDGELVLAYVGVKALGDAGVSVHLIDVGRVSGVGALDEVAVLIGSQTLGLHGHGVCLV